MVKQSLTSTIRNFLTKRTGDEVALVKTLLRYVLVLYVMGVTNDLADGRGTLLPDSYAPLPDIFFDFIPNWQGVGWIPDKMVSFAYMLVLGRILTAQANRLRLGMAFVELHTCLLLLRCVTVALTIFPAPTLKCAYKMPSKPSYFLIEPILRMLRPDGMSSWCHDMLFSGHAMLFVLAALFLSQSSGSKFWRYIGWVLAIPGIFLLLAARVHYSVDIAVAIIITTLVFEQWKAEIAALFSNRIVFVDH
jgi:hypothetical protein